jgi:regulator of nucleoside diphosphate kinase
MNTNTAITLSELDFTRLNSLIERKYVPFSKLPELDELDQEVQRASIVKYTDVPPNLVTMNTRFRFLNTTDNQFGEITLVYPSVADEEKGWISVTTSLGMAFLGLKEHDEIDWNFPDGKTKTLRVLQILYQPESNGFVHH